MSKKTNTRLKPVNQHNIDWNDYEKRVTEYENQGMTRSDAQGIVDMELELGKENNEIWTKDNE